MFWLTDWSIDRRAVVDLDVDVAAATAALATAAAVAGVDEVELADPELYWRMPALTELSLNESSLLE